MSPWAWLAVTCLLLAASGGVRLWREWGFWTLAARSAACPFRLADLPRSMGTWQMLEDSELPLDPEVARIAGASEHFTRTYLDQKSGERVAALALYGPCVDAFGHVPEICYPAAGYQPFQGPTDGELPVAGLKEPVRYRWAIYAKREGGVVRLEEVYYTFLHKGEWVPDVSDRWKQFRYYPGLFKIQLARPITGVTQPGEEPVPSLLAEFARQISERVAAAGSGPGSGGAPAMVAAGHPMTP